VAAYKGGQIVRFVYNHPPEGVDANTGDKSKEVLVLNPNYHGKMHGIDLKRITDADRKVLKAILNPLNMQNPESKTAPTLPVKPGALPPTAKPPVPGAMPAKPQVPGSMHGKASGLSSMTPEKRAEMLKLYGNPAEKKQAEDMRWAQATPLVKDILRRMNPLKEIQNPVVFYVKFVRPFLRGKDAYRQYWLTHIVHPVIVSKTDVTGKVINPKPLFKKVETKPKHPFSMSAFARTPGTPEETARQERMAAAKADRIRKEKARLAAKAQYAAKKAGLGKVVKPAVTKPKRNK
jgi:hypothetical protein